MALNLKNLFEKSIPSAYQAAVSSAAETAERNNISMYLIGGAARDLILNTAVKDIDIMIEGSALDFARLLEKEGVCRIVSVNENLRTLKAEFSSGAVIDFASSREEYYKTAGSMPIACSFGCTLENDVKRRDFTINTLAVSLTGDAKYGLIDFFGGYDDIKNKKIRILHEKSFIDDPSRIIRALKFQMRLGFEIEEKTLMLMLDYLNAPDRNIPLERIKNELKDYFSLPQKGLYENLIKYKAYKLVTDTAFFDFKQTAFDEIKKYCPIERIWFLYAALLLINADIENPHLNLTALEKKTIKEAEELIKHGALNINDNFEIYSAFIDKTELAPLIYYSVSQDRTVLKFYEALKDVKLLITGKDLIDLGFTPSRYFSEIFDKVLKEKIEGRLKTKEEEIKFAGRFLK